jgi:endonuclease III
MPPEEAIAMPPDPRDIEAVRARLRAEQGEFVPHRRLPARRIQRILTIVEQREHRLDLSRLHELDDAAVESYLASLPGVGPKTAACVLVFAMGRAAFPVDTHVQRIVTRLGWIPPGTTAGRTYRILGPLIPPPSRYDLHVAFITHGRKICDAQRPRCPACVLRDLCQHAR